MTRDTERRGIMAVMMGNLAGYENRIADLKTELKTELAAVRGELSLLKWMVGFNLAMTAALLVRLFLGNQ